MSLDCLVYFNLFSFYYDWQPDSNRHEFERHQFWPEEEKRERERRKEDAREESSQDLEREASWRDLSRVEASNAEWPGSGGLGGGEDRGRGGGGRGGGGSIKSMTIRNYAPYDVVVIVEFGSTSRLEGEGHFRLKRKFLGKCQFDIFLKGKLISMYLSFIDWINELLVTIRCPKIRVVVP